METKRSFITEDLNSGYLVELRNGEHRILIKVNNGTKILVNPKTDAWNYLSHWNTDGTVRYGINLGAGESQLSNKTGAIMKVWGRVTGTLSYGLALSGCETGRSLLWQRRDPVKMTVAKICEKLGYEVEIVADVNPQSDVPAEMF